MIRALLLAALVVQTLPGVAAVQPRSRTMTWEDLAPLHRRLELAGITQSTFPEHVQRLQAINARRVREGELDHLVFYMLQSTRFTRLPPIEPALSAKALVESLSPAERDSFTRDPQTAARRLPKNVRARMTALLRALASPGRDERLLYFHELVTSVSSGAGSREALLAAEYLRVMKFLWDKEFVAQRSARPHDAVSELYRTRGLSTDTAVESGFLVHEGLGVLRALEQETRVRRVLIIGPGLDISPRTALQEDAPPQSYQPWAVMDSLLALGLAREGDIEVVAADINPRVVSHLQRLRARPPELWLASELANSTTITLSQEYRDYFSGLGRAIATETAKETQSAGRLQKRVRVTAAAARALRAERLDIVTERLADGRGFDLIVATNILPYFGEVELTLAMTNIAAMLAPGGTFLHNEARPAVHELSTVLGLPFLQSRQATVATVRGGAPLVDSVWLHRMTPPARRK